MNGPIVVVGDLLLDRDIIGSADRLCPDAPVPVLTEECVTLRPGGAGLAATFLAEDGADVRLLGCVGADDPGEALRALLAHVGVPLVELPYDGPTPEKIRLRAGGHPLLRLDRGTAGGRIGGLPPVAATVLRSASAVLVSDYGRGLTSVAGLRRILAITGARVPIVWDPHPKGATPIPGARLVCPNRTEAAGFAATLGAGLDSGRGGDAAQEPHPAVAAEASILRSTWRVGAVAVTMSERGALVAEAGQIPLTVPAIAGHGNDPCGAGDRFAAAATIALARGWPTGEAVAFAVEVASRYVAANGPTSLRQRFEHQPSAKAST